MSKRTLKYKTIAKSENAPEVGSVVEEKDTIFVKQITATEFEVFVSDETGYVVKLDKTIDKASFDQMVLEYIKEHSVDIQNTFTLAQSKHAYFYKDPRENLDFIFNHKGEKVTITNEQYNYIVGTDRNREYVKYLYRENGDIVLSGENYPNDYILIENVGIIGKNLTEGIPISYDSSTDRSDINQFSFSKIEGIDDIQKKNINIILPEELTNLGLQNTYKKSEYDVQNISEITPGDNSLYYTNGKLYFRFTNTYLMRHDSIQILSQGRIVGTFHGRDNNPIEIDANDITELEFKYSETE